MVSTSAPQTAFDPLGRIIFHDVFDHGLQGWTGLIGNYEDSLDSILPGFQDLRAPMLSNASAWDTGTTGTLSGTYAMKLATRPHAGSMAVGIKRTTFRRPGPIRLEAYFAFKPEASELKLSETDVGVVGVCFDLQQGDRVDAPLRVMPHLRYVNAVDGRPVGRWQYKERREALHAIGGSGKTQSHFHLGPGGWEDIPGSEQRLCYNEIATKLNWHYFRLDFDLESMRFRSMQCNDLHLDLQALGVAPMRIPAMANLWCMLNTLFWVEAGSAKRTFLYVDSVMLSGDF